MKEILQEIEKLKYQIQQIGETLDSKKHPIPSLIISFDWDERKLNKAHDIFEKFHNLLEGGTDPSWPDFENRFRFELSVDYQRLKFIVISFHRNFQWTNVCEAYAKKNKCIEFHEIMKNQNP